MTGVFNLGSGGARGENLHAQFASLRRRRRFECLRDEPSPSPWRSLQLPRAAQNPFFAVASGLEFCSAGRERGFRLRLAMWVDGEETPVKDEAQASEKEAAESSAPEGRQSLPPSSDFGLGGLAGPDDAADGNSGEEDDPVVKVIDVYLRRLDEVVDCGGPALAVGGEASSAQTLCNQNTGGTAAAASAPSHAAQVFVMQFPMRPSDRPYGDQGQLQQVAWRRQQHQLRLTYSLHSQGANYDTNHPLHLQAVASGAETTHVLRSQASPATECSYAVGVLRDNKLFLTPVQQLLQFKPDFSAYEALYSQQHPQPVSGGGTHKRGTNSQTGSASSNEALASNASADSIAPSAENAAETPLNAQTTQLQATATGEGRGRISNSRQRDIEENEPWLPIEVRDSERTSRDSLYGCQATRPLPCVSRLR